MTYSKLASTAGYSLWTLFVVLMALPFKIAKDLSHWINRGTTYMVASADEAIAILEAK